MKLRHACVLGLAIVGSGVVSASPEARHRHREGPLVAVLMPADGAHVNASALHLTALVAARQTDRTPELHLCQ
jgi:hypothetical protein